MVQGYGYVDNGVAFFVWHVARARSDPRVTSVQAELIAMALLMFDHDLGPCAHLTRSRER